MNLRTAVSISVLGISAVFGALSLALSQTTDLLDQQALELARAGESVHIAQSLKNRLLAHNRNDFLYQLDNDPSRFESREAQRDEIAEFLLQAEHLINNEDERRVVDEVKQVTAAYLARRDDLGGRTASLTEKYQLASVEADDAIAVVDQLIEVNRTQMEQLSAAIGERNRQADFVAGILFVVGAAILSFIAIAVFVFIAGPVTKLARAIDTFTNSGVATPVEPRSVAEIETLSANFNSMTERLEARRKDQLRFIGSIAHDLRNPLGSMSITTELLLRQQPAENMRMLELIFRQVKLLDRLVNDLLDTTHIESGHLELRVSMHDVAALVRDAVDLHRTASELHRFVLEVDEDLDCMCDGARLSQVINNLLSNAMKYSPNGGLIKVKAWREGACIAVSVADQGIGIDPEDLHNIFKPFHRTRATKGTIPGIGLGLSTSKRIVEAHGGAFKVDSKPMEGATFQIKLPCEAAG